MPDITELLDVVARPAVRPLDLAAVQRRGDTLARQRRVVIAASVAAGLAAVAALPFLVSGRDGALQQLRQDDIPGTHPTSVLSSTPRPNVAVLPPGAAGPGEGARSGADPSPGASQRPAAPSPLPSAPLPLTTGGTDGAFPPARSCHVSTTEPQTSDVWECRFTAQVPGGWRVTRGAAVFAGYAPARLLVTVERAGAVVYRSDTSDEDCASGVIRQGDRVTVRIHRESSTHVEQTDLGAGDGYGCP